MIRLSIIIPFYNVERYIAQCLDRVFNQDVPEVEYEVICVNDGSPDNSREIVIEYQKKHKNLILIEHEHNKKLGAARNTGRSIARGKYIWNVDSDDYIATNCLKNILSQCEKNELDVLMFNVAAVINSTIKIDGFIFDEQDGKNYKGIDCIDKNKYQIGYLCPIWRYVYSKDFLDRNAIYSPEINMGEDIPYTFKALVLAERVKLVNMICYYCRQNQNSLTLTKTLHPYILYEKSYLAARILYDVLKFIPYEYEDVKKSVKNVIRYVMYIYEDYYSNFACNEKKMFVSICRKNMMNDMCLFRIMGSSYKFKYVKLLLGLL